MTVRHLPIALMVFIAGLSQMSETLYTPSLPQIAEALNTAESMVEHTLTIYLVGFALGVFFWGIVSDRVGRKPCILMGLGIFMVSCFVCYHAKTINMLMVGRLFQGFGASIGSVLSQAMFRDVFQGKALGQAYSIIGAALFTFPAVGPIIGGWVAEYFQWSYTFLLLIVVGGGVSCVALKRLPETHIPSKHQAVPITQVFFRMIQDRRVLGLGLIVAGGNGIYFSYFAEGSFCLIQCLGLSPSTYGYTFTLLALGAMGGALFAKRLHKTHEGFKILGLGVHLSILSTWVTSVLMVAHAQWSFMSSPQLISLIVISQAVSLIGTGIGGGTALSLALVEYRDCVGTASSFFGAFYYIFVSLITWGMGALHNGSLTVMPVYFLCIHAVMVATYHGILKQYTNQRQPSFT